MDGRNGVSNPVLDLPEAAHKNMKNVWYRQLILFLESAILKRQNGVEWNE